jgi:hypothetical protein
MLKQKVRHTGPSQTRAGYSQIRPKKAAAHGVE